MALVPDDEPPKQLVPDEEQGWLPYLGQKADDTVRAAANAVTFGMADRLAGNLPTWLGGEGGGTDASVKLSQQARERSPIASTVGDIAGAVAIPGMGGARIASSLGSGLGARALGYGIEGGVVGGLQGAGTTYTGNPEDYLTNAGKGVFFGAPLGAAAGAAFAPRPAVSSAPTPTLDQLTATTNRAYDTLRNIPVPYSAPHVSAAADAAERAMAQNFHPAATPIAYRLLDELRAFDTGPGATVTPAQLHQVRQMANTLPAGPERAAAWQVKNAIDNFITNPPAGAVAAGDQAAAAEAARVGRLAVQSRLAQGRLETVGNMQQRASDLAEGAASGLNFENKMRQEVNNRIFNPWSQAAQQRRARFNPDEQAALRNVTNPGALWDTSRYIDRMLGGGGGLGAVISGATAGHFLSGDPVGGALYGAVAPAAGLVLRGINNRAAANRINAVNEMVAQRSPLYEAWRRASPMVPGPSPLSGANTSNLRDAITYELMKQQEPSYAP